MGVSFHAFAYDTQLYVHCRRDDVMSAVRRLENCIDDVSHWMSANRLELNADKTELLWARSRHGPAVLGSAGPSLQLKTETVMVSDQVRVLGVTMSSDLSLVMARYISYRIEYRDTEVVSWHILIAIITLSLIHI